MPSENKSKIVRSYAFTIAQLPEPPETFLKKETDLSHSNHAQFRENGIIEKTPPTQDRPYTWQVPKRIWNEATSYVQNTDTLPCCHRGRGVTNKDGEMVCQECGETVTLSELRKVT